mmetsp:Transcript_34093/g.89907  ORF Transcript_34093/g.89907 Transcript_34093/m.89907 type:complete len:211 (-) Transcript_34093:617-1249(-)
MQRGSVLVIHGRIAETVHDPILLGVIPRSDEVPTAGEEVVEYKDAQGQLQNVQRRSQPLGLDPFDGLVEPVVHLDGADKAHNADHPCRPGGLTHTQHGVRAEEEEDPIQHDDHHVEAEPRTRVVVGDVPGPHVHDPVVRVAREERYANVDSPKSRRDLVDVTEGGLYPGDVEAREFDGNEDQIIAHDQDAGDVPSHALRRVGVQNAIPDQ